jgi:hypothetical protein
LIFTRPHHIIIYSTPRIQQNLFGAIAYKNRRLYTMESQFDPEALTPFEQPSWKQILASIIEQNKRITEENDRRLKRMTEHHELFMMKMEMETLQFLKAIKDSDTQSEVVIPDESVKRKTTNSVAVEITNEPTVTAATKEQVENTTRTNESEATMINQPAPPKNRSGENLPTEIDNEQAKITYDTAEIATEPTEYEVITDEPADITELAEYEITDEPTPSEITLNILASEPVQINVLSTKPLEIIYEPAEVISLPDKATNRPVEREIIASVPTEISNRLADAQAGTETQNITDESDEEVITDRPAKGDAVTNKPAENIKKLAGIVIEPAGITDQPAVNMGKRVNTDTQRWHITGHDVMPVLARGPNSYALALQGVG